MTLDQAWTHTRTWLVRIVSVVILALIAISILRHFGVSLPIRPMGHVELAYLAGAFWLVTR